ncbi:MULTISPECIES: DUF4762 family protein [unclassified Serratia (in: enterobacteria)]|uniref:DUF4762 family protein n=1 Tax=unclassified Serratia (in: enterobacteria) TaxID=2647522 RepID=UPI00046AEBAF|nr:MULTISPECIES: DUF4762 family protein [unclassified Serratia (in: enterobacteria)]
MKKLNESAVANVVGGATTSSCKVSYSLNKLELGSLIGMNVCTRVSTCEGKFGEPVVTKVPVALSNCEA